MEFFSEPAQRIRARSLEQGAGPPIEIVGRSAAFVDVLTKLEKVARYAEPVLITGDSGVGKENFGRTLHVLGCPKGPYIPVNCPQFQEGNVTVSELFGHVRGSFTGAIGDSRGAFEQAEGGLLFLDEIGDLPSTVQAMLLRALSTGEYRPMGSMKSRTVNARIASATNRPLNELIMSGSFRYDLFFRLRHFHLAIPSLKERDDDWRLLLDYWLEKMREKYGVAKRFSPRALAELSNYPWPGNVRQLIGFVTTGYAMADGEVIEPEDFESLMDPPPGLGDGGTGIDIAQTQFDAVVQGGANFWETVCQPYLNRELNRDQVRAIVRKGLDKSRGSYRRMLDVLHLPSSDYQKLMDFLRHHDLKP